ETNKQIGKFQTAAKPNSLLPVSTNDIAIDGLDTDIYGNLSAMKDTSIPVERLPTYIDGLSQNDNAAFKAEFDQLPSTPQAKYDVSSKQENKVRNRFVNIPTYDHTRVVLDTTSNDTDYISASYIEGYGDTKKRYIALQGPKVNTVNDTWRLLWQENIALVVTLTNLVENGKKKCEKYWPDNEHKEHYGDITVEAMGEETRNIYTKRIFCVKKKEDPGEREIVQYHFTGWLDHSAPSNSGHVIYFHRLVMAAK
ncbi:unnamed protein product, partial [Owenia fusiformis]